MTIRVTPEFLCELCAPNFTIEGAYAICDYFDEIAPSDACTIGDICVSFSEVEYVPDELEEDSIVAVLSNGNAIILN
jgi:hypothetical protein